VILEFKRPEELQPNYGHYQFLLFKIRLLLRNSNAYLVTGLKSSQVYYQQKYRFKLCKEQRNSQKQEIFHD
jgi:predicted nucleotidyltransferase